MPRDIPQSGLAVFATVNDPDQKYTEYVYVRAHAGETVAQICARRGRSDMVNKVLELNRHVLLSHHHYLRSAYSKLKANTKIRLPGTLAEKDHFAVMLGPNRPKVKSGYAKYDNVDRPGRLGLNRFLGYDPSEVEIEVQFESYFKFNGSEIERDIDKLERMAGRGNYPGAADGAPAIIKVEISDNTGTPIPLMGHNYQWSKANPTAPTYRISNITWHEGDLSDDKGRRVRAMATITVKQYTPLHVVQRTAAQRAKSKATKRAKSKH